MERKDVKNLSLDELKRTMARLSEDPYRAEQVYSWIYQKGVESFREMKNLPKGLIDKMAERFYIASLKLREHLVSKDGTEKLLFGLEDGNLIESVLIHAPERKTVCISTQVGCRYRCLFCASGKIGFIRDLTASEIVGQALFIRNKLKRKISNYVFMGMGEPLDNYVNTEKAILIMNDKKGLDIGSRRITISTCGLVPGIEKLKGLEQAVNLSISLHAVDNSLRDELVPANRRYPIEQLIKACESYMDKKRRIITLEYVLIDRKNDSAKDAEKLAKIAKKLRAKINLLACNPVSAVDCNAPSADKINSFMRKLKRNGASVTLRRSKGNDIYAACGQLAGKVRRTTVS